MLFKLKEVETNNQEKAETNNSAFTSSFRDKHLAKIKNAGEILNLPNNGDILFLQTLQAFNAFTLIEKMAKEHFIEELVATTYSVSMRVLEALQNLQNEKRIGKIYLVISDSMMSRNPKVTDALDAWATLDENVQIVYTWNHSKITLAKCGSNYFGIEGSGNWSENACYEQYLVFNDKQAYEFRKELFYDCKVVRSVK